MSVCDFWWADAMCDYCGAKHEDMPDYMADEIDEITERPGQLPEYVCPRCGRSGCPCCMGGGRNCLCPECEEGQ